MILSSQRQKICRYANFVCSIFLLRKSICFRFAQTRYDMNSRCRKVTYRAVRHIEFRRNISKISQRFISLHQMKKEQPFDCSFHLVREAGHSLAMQALLACCHLAWHQADNCAPLGYKTIHRIVLLNASCPLRVQVPFIAKRKEPHL